MPAAVALPTNTAPNEPALEAAQKVSCQDLGVMREGLFSGPSRRRHAIGQDAPPIPAASAHPMIGETAFCRVKTTKFISVAEDNLILNVSAFKAYLTSKSS